MNLKLKEIISVLVFISIILSIRLSVLIPSMVTDKAMSVVLSIEGENTQPVVACEKMNSTKKKQTVGNSTSI